MTVCPRCNGNGSVPYHIADDLFDETNCPLCGGSGEVLTNEEWIKSMNTEQLAKRLHDKDVYAFFVCKNGGKVPSVESYVEWLNQPHNSPK